MDSPRAHKTTVLTLALILCLSFFLNTQGIGWGLPDRWNIDQKVTEALRMASAGTLVSSDFYHPPFYTYLLMLVLAPYFLYLKIIHYPLADAGSAASDSWIRVAALFPGFATNLFLIARLLSGLLGTLTVLVIFFLARRMYGARIALLAAAILATTMGFAGANHFEFSCALVGLLCMLVVLLCVRELDLKTGRNIMAAAFVSGLAVATKMNGIFVLALPFAAYFISVRRRSAAPLSAVLRMTVFSKKTASLCLLAGAGFLAGWPTFFTTLYGVKVGASFYKEMLFASHIDVPAAVNFLNYLIQLVVIFGVPFSIFVVLGVAIAVRRLFSSDPSNGKFVIAGLVMAPYLVMNGISVHHYYAYTKYVILIVPLLAIMGAVGIDALLKLRHRAIGAVIASAAIIYSLVYTIEANAHFVDKDTRYRSTAWIEAHIPAGSTIEHVDQADWLFSSRILKGYRIVYLGRDSRSFTGKGFYKINATGDLAGAQAVVEAYCRTINERMPSSDYFVLFVPERADLNRQEVPQGEYDKMVSSFLSGRFPYRLEASFMPSNWKVVSPAVKGLSYPRDFFREPVPDSAFLSPVILIYKRNRAG